MKNVTLNLFLLLLTAVILPSVCGLNYFNDGKTDSEDKNVTTVDNGSGIESFENICFVVVSRNHVIRNCGEDNDEPKCSEFECNTKRGITQCISNKDKCNMNGSLVIFKNGDVMTSNNKGGEMVISAPKDGDVVSRVSTNQRGPLRLVIQTKNKNDDLKTLLLIVGPFLLTFGVVKVIFYYCERQISPINTTNS